MQRIGKDFPVIGNGTPIGDPEEPLIIELKGGLLKRIKEMSRKQDMPEVDVILVSVALGIERMESKDAKIKKDLANFKEGLRSKREGRGK